MLMVMYLILQVLFSLKIFYYTKKSFFSDPRNASKDVPLYNGSRISVLESMVLIITFVMRHQLTREATKDLLSLLELHCLTPNLCRSSMHMFYNFFSELTSPVQKHYFCDFCKEYSGIISREECTFCGKKKEKHFMYIPIAGQLQSILSGKIYFPLHSKAFFFINFLFKNRIKKFRLTKSLKKYHIYHIASL